MLEGKTAHRGGDVCVMCVSLAKSLLRRSFLFPSECTWLLSCLRALGRVRAHFDFDLSTDSSSDSLEVSIGLLYNWLSNRCTSRINIFLLPSPP